ncbi:MAG: WecB/TagA/CpsF family glycosyltransferase [Candidatus Omnitrophica bacterium]|nr:WecB/TagA/CpsF family glycosyltransferase [Candidatus Omnitrophota bacterium]
MPLTKKIHICKTEIDNISMSEAIAQINHVIQRKKPCYMVTPNVVHLIRLQGDKHFQEIYKNAIFRIADGLPLLWAARFLGTPLKEKISGSDLFPRLCELAVQKGYKLFFLGGNPGDAEKAKTNLMNKYPQIEVVGTYSPPYGFEKDESENKKIISIIKESKPDILLVGLGAPKQEKWIYRYYREIAVPLSIGIGITFSFMAGTIKRAPLWMQKSGLEWFWRLMMEPGRLWKRYLIDDMKFFWLVYKQKMGQEKK